MHKYEINGKTYTQKKIVLGQLNALKELLGGVKLADFSAAGLIDSLGPSLPMAMAIVLIPKGCESLRARDLEAMAAEMDEVEVEVALDVVADFFDCNQLSLLLEKLAATMDRVWATTGSRDSSAPSPTETSASESQSSGAAA